MKPYRLLFTLLLRYSVMLSNSFIVNRDLCGWKIKWEQNNNSVTALNERMNDIEKNHNEFSSLHTEVKTDSKENLHEMKNEVKAGFDNCKMEISAIFDKFIMSQSKRIETMLVDMRDDVDRRFLEEEVKVLRKEIDNIRRKEKVLEEKLDALEKEKQIKEKSGVPWWDRYQRIFERIHRFFTTYR